MRILVATIAVLALAGAVTAMFLTRPRLTAAERGRRLAERTGCFACHGPGGLRGIANPGRVDKTVPNYTDDVMMYVRTADEIREWIRDGVSRRRRQSTTWREQVKRGALRMPAFRDRLSRRGIDDLTAYVMAVSGMPEPKDSLALAGLERAEALGCFGCHGAGGRLAQRNPGSLKGYVPSWDGRDFAELVSSRAEFDEWVKAGVSRRLEKNLAARYFLDRAVLRMPAYRDHLAPGDLDALWAYVEWLRSP